MSSPLADVGKKVRLLVTATNPDGTGSRASAPTATVNAAPPVNTALPAVTGATLRGTTLSATPGTWSGPGVGYAYQWQRDLGSGYTDIAGATGATYLLGVADVGATIRIRVTATNADASVSATSIGSSVVRGGQPVSLVAPTIAGTARRTSTLTSTPGTWGGIENDYAFQWQRRVNGTFTDIAGATGTTYTLDSADVGTVIRLRVTASNLDGALSAFSATTATVVAAPPRNTAPPTVTGAAKLSETLTATPGDWTPAGATYAYAWQRDGVDIPGANGSTYVLRAADLGKSVRVKVTATNVDGSADATSAAGERVAAPPVNTVAPAAPSGTPQEASTLTAVPGTWDTPGASLHYTWLRCPADATAVSSGCEEAGTGTTYTLTAADVGRRLGVRVVATSSGGTSTAASALTGTIVRLDLRNLTPPSVAGDAYAGETLNGDAGRWTFPSADVVYDWQRCDADGNSNCASVGSGSPQYTLDADDADHTIVLVVAATTPGQSATARSAPLTIQSRPVPRSIVAPAVTGTAIRGRTLTADPGTWTDSTRFSYQWLRCNGTSCQEIAGATGDTYVLTAADKGFSMSVVVTAANAWRSASAQAAPTAPVAAAPPVNTSVPVISSSSPVIGQGATLTAGGATWNSTSDTTYRLSWERCTGGVCRPISGANGVSYTLLAADVGSQLVVVITATNGDGAVSARSAQTVTVLVGGPRWKTLPTISNSTGRVGDSVTVTPGTFSGPAVTSDVTEMMRCTNVCTPRGTANARNYTIADSDLGAILRVRETASNSGGETIVWSSRYVGPVTNAQAAAAVLKAGNTSIRNAQGATLAVATLSGSKPGVAHASAATSSAPKVGLRRPAKVKGKLVAWACPATIGAGATPPPCSAKVSLRKRATLRLPASTTGDVRVVVIRAKR